MFSYGEQQEIQRLYSEEGVKGNDNWGKVRNADQFDRKVREYIEPLVKPNVKILDLVNLIEDKIREEVQKSIEESQVLYGPQINGGIAFPTGISINNVAAHYTPLRKDETIIKETNNLL